MLVLWLLVGDTGSLKFRGRYGSEKLATGFVLVELVMVVVVFRCNDANPALSLLSPVPAWEWE